MGPWLLRYAAGARTLHVRQELRRDQEIPRYRSCLGRYLAVLCGCDRPDRSCGAAY